MLWVGLGPSKEWLLTSCAWPLRVLGLSPWAVYPPPEPPHDLGLSQQGVLRVVAPFTWQLASGN